MKPKPSASSEIKALRKQLTSLQKAVGKLQKAALAASKPRRLRATRAVVNSIQVVDAAGKVVAEIDSKGNLFCRTIWASTDKNIRGVFIDGVTFRSVQAGKLQLIGLNGNNPAVEINGWGTTGDLTVRDLSTRQQVQLHGSGNAIRATDDQGALTVSISGHHPAGGKIELMGTGKAAKAKAQVSILYPNNAGAIALIDSTGKQVGHLP